MIRRSSGIYIGMVIALGSIGCQQAPPNEGPLESRELPSQGPATAPLVEIMQDLATDMAVAAGGVWVEDAEQVAAAARRIADHPKVSPEDRAVIQSVLGQEFGSFVMLDQEVHGAAVELAEAAAGGGEVSHLLTLYTRIQQGCVGCHDVFRADVASALARPPGGE